LTSKNTKPELRLQDGLRARGLNFDLHVRELPGTPDIVFFDSKLAVFVHGCYWHRHNGCTTQRKPTEASVKVTKTRNSTVLNDANVARNLQEIGWKQYIAWECHVNLELAKVLNDIQERLVIR
jgi:DNA mismatch endonuclease (patch repair protein)